MPSTQHDGVEESILLRAAGKDNSLKSEIRTLSKATSELFACETAMLALDRQKSQLAAKFHKAHEDATVTSTAMISRSAFSDKMSQRVLSDIQKTLRDR